MPRIATMALAAVTMALVPITAMAQTTAAPSVGVSHSATILPEDTFLHLTVPDAEAFCDRFTTTSGAGLYTGDETAALREKFMAFWGQGNSIVQGQIGLTVDEILENASGELAFAVTQAPGTPLSGVMIIGFEKEEIVNTLIEQIEGAYESQGGQISRASTGGVEIATAAVPDGEVDAEMLSMNYFVADNKWVIGTNRAILEKLVENWDGSARRSLANSDIYAEMLEKVDLGQDRAPAILMFADPISLVKEIGTLVSQLNPEAAMPIGMGMGFLPLTGLEGLLGVMQATDFNTVEGNDAISKQFVYVERPSQGVLKVFETKTRELAPPSWIPATAASYAALSWQVDGAYDEVERLVDNTMGQPGKTAAFLDQLRDMPNGPGIHVKEDILDQLEGTFRTVTVPGESGSISDLGGRQLFAMELARTHNMDEVLARISESANGELETRDFRGTTIYEFEMPAQTADGDFGTKVAGFAIAQEQIAFATDVTLLEEIIRGDAGDALANSEAFENATEGVPTEGVSFAYTDAAAAVKPIYEFAQKGGFDPMIRQSDEAAWVADLLADLPAFDEIEKYLGKTVGYGEKLDDGILTTTHYLPNDQ